MADAVEIAVKQRHLYLLGKVKANNPLSKGELKELREYENMARKSKTGTDTLGTGAQRHKGTKVKSRKKTTSGSATGKKKKAKKRTKSKRRPIGIAKVKKLAFECEDFTEADTLAQANRLADCEQPLSELIEQYPDLKKAWQRGRLLRNLKDLSAHAATIGEAESELSMAAGQLTELLKSDLEVADIWNQARLATVRDIKRAVIKAAKKGQTTALKNVERILRREIAKSGIDYRSVTLPEMVQITGKSRQAVHAWHAEYGLRRNSDGTFDLRVFIPWFEEFTLKKANRGSKAVDHDPFKAAKTERLEIELQRQKGRLLDRDMVMAGQLARQQLLVNALGQRAEQLATVCNGQPPEKIIQILNESFADIRRQQCQVPEQLRLPPAAEKQFAELLESLRPEGEE